MEQADCYQNYMFYKNKIDNNEMLKHRIRAFKRKQFDLESRKAQGIAIDGNEEKSLSDEYFDMMLNIDCEAFISSEREVIKMLSQVYDELGKKVALDLSFLE